MLGEHPVQQGRLGARNLQASAGNPVVAAAGFTDLMLASSPKQQQKAMYQTTENENPVAVAVDAGADMSSNTIDHFLGGMEIEDMLRMPDADVGDTP